MGIMVFLKLRVWTLESEMSQPYNMLFLKTRGPEFLLFSLSKGPKISSGDIPNSMRCSSARKTPQPSQNLVEPWWNCGTLAEPYLRAAPDHPGAYLGLSTPKLAAVGEKPETKLQLGSVRPAEPR